VALLQLHRRRYVAEHLVFSVHFFTFALLYLPLVVGLMRLVLRGERRGMASVASGTTLVTLLVGGIVAHLAVALHRVYGGRAWVALAQAAVLVWGLVMFARVYATAVHMLAAWMT
jgi:hypothetical protein